MKTIIIEVDGTELITVQLDREMGECLNRVGCRVHKLLCHPQVRQNAAKCDPHLLELCERGARRLTILGERKEATLMIDATFMIDAHTAACLLAKSRSLNKNERGDLLQALGFLAAILPIWLMIDKLPPWEEIQAVGKYGGRIQQIYEVLRNQIPSDMGFYPIKMCDALILHEGLKFKRHPLLQPVQVDLDHVTLTHRNALAQLMRRAR